MRIAPIGGGLIASQVYCSVVGLCFTLGVVEAKPPRQADIALCAVTGVSLAVSYTHLTLPTNREV